MVRTLDKIESSKTMEVSLRPFQLHSPISCLRFINTKRTVATFKITTDSVILNYAPTLIKKSPTSLTPESTYKHTFEIVLTAEVCGKSSIGGVSKCQQRSQPLDQLLMKFQRFHRSVHLKLVLQFHLIRGVLKCECDFLVFRIVGPPILSRTARSRFLGVDFQRRNTFHSTILRLMKNCIIAES